MYSFSGKITLDDFVQYRVFLQREYLLRRMLCVFLMYPILFVVCIIVNMIFQEDMQFFEYVPTVTVAAVLFLVWMYITSRRAYVFRNARNAYESDTSLREELGYVLDENGITVTTGNGHVTCAWEKAHRVKTDRDSIYIFTEFTAAFIVKERFFKTAAEFHQAKDYAMQQYAVKKQAIGKAK